LSQAHGNVESKGGIVLIRTGWVDSCYPTPSEGPHANSREPGLTEGLGAPTNPLMMKCTVC